MHSGYWLSETPSTNDWLKARRELPHGTWCATDRQTAGRGRRGRTWDAPDGKTLALSVLLHGGARPTLPLVCAMAAAETLTALTDFPFAWKWPNDIICDNRKVCGILCESVAEGDRIDVIAGLGINLTQTKEELERAGLPYAGSVEMLTGKPLSPQRVAEALIARLTTYAERLDAEGLAPFLPAYADGCITLGRRVRVQNADGATLLTGVAESIDDGGALMVRTEDGTLTRCDAGEVSVRGLYGYTGEETERE